MPQFMRTSNPALNDRVFRGQPMAFGQTMTIQGTVNKTGILLVLVMLSAAFTWHLAYSGSPAAVMPLMWVGLIGGMIAAFATIFKMNWAPVTAPIYALFEGLALGGISAVFDMRFHGIAFEAVCLTFGVLFMMLLLYKSGIIRVTQRFRMGVFAATGAIMLFYFVEMILGMFHVGLGPVNAVNGSGLIGIGFSLLVVGIAALNLVLDFDLIDQGARYNAPKYMEWYGGFALMVTLVWLYLEILNLLAKLQSRD